jgi:hypothetical protein
VWCGASKQALQSRERFIWLKETHAYTQAKLKASKSQHKQTSGKKLDIPRFFDPGVGVAGHVHSIQPLNHKNIDGRRSRGK